MKNLIFILIACISIVTSGQVCNYGSSSNDASDLCNLIQGSYMGNNFSSYKNADIALDKVLSVTGMSKRFVLKECNDISNCVATAYKGIRYILYDRDFMDDISSRTNSWTNISILAHEVGHHVNGHSLDLVVYAADAADVPTLSESRQMEIEADEYSGFIMAKLGATLYQSQQAVNIVATNADDSYSTHPSKDKRLKAVERGYNKAKSQSSNNDYSNSSLTADAEEYFYKAYNNKSDYQYQIDNYTKCLRINPNYAEALQKRGYAFMELERYNEAIDDFTSAIRINPDQNLLYMLRADSHRNLERYNDAIDDYTSAIRISLLTSKEGFDKFIITESYYMRGFTYSNYLQRDSEAIDDYTRAIEMNPNFADAYAWRGQSKYMLGLNYCNDYKKACNLGGESGCNWFRADCR